MTVLSKAAAARIIGAMSVAELDEPYEYSDALAALTPMPPALPRDALARNRVPGSAWDLGWRHGWHAAQRALGQPIRMPDHA